MDVRRRRGVADVEVVARDDVRDVAIPRPDGQDAVRRAVGRDDSEEGRDDVVVDGRRDEE